MRRTPLATATLLMSLSAAAQVIPAGRALPSPAPAANARLTAAPTTSLPRTPAPNPGGPQAAQALLAASLKPASVTLRRPRGGQLTLHGQLPSGFRVTPGRQPNEAVMRAPALMAPLQLSFFVNVDSDATVTESGAAVQRQGRDRIVRTSSTLNDGRVLTHVQVTRPARLISFGPKLACGASWNHAGLSANTEAQLTARTAQVCASFLDGR